MTGRQSAMYGLAVLTVLVSFAFYLFSFTVFEGYSTLSSDSFSYIRQALLWSPYSEAADHVVETLPEHVRAPGWSWVLALSGGAESTVRAHLVVSVLLLLSIAICGWMAFRAAGFTIGLTLTVILCLLPGALVSSLGILSENLFLFASLCTLLVTGALSERSALAPGAAFKWGLALLACLLLAILTRSAGLALVLALMIAAAGNTSWNTRARLVLALAGMLAIFAWLAWDAKQTGSGLPAEYSYLVSIFSGHEKSLSESFSVLLQAVIANVRSMAAAWNHYLNLGHENVLLFGLSFLLLAVVLVCTVLRAMRLRADGLYVLGYLAIIMLWPFPSGMLRFLHPIIPLLLLQPLLLHGERDTQLPRRRTGAVLLIGLGLVLTGAIAGQARLLEFRSEAKRNYPGIEHSFEFYASTNRAAAVMLPHLWQETLEQMREVARVVPEGATVATVKHEAFMLVAGRKAVMLTTLVPYSQQVCNFLLQGVDYVFLPQINSSFVPRPFDLVDAYADVTDYVLTLADSDDRPRAHVLKLNRDAYGRVLSGEVHRCEEVLLQ